MAEADDLRIEQDEDRRWQELKDAVDQGYRDLCDEHETAEEFEARMKRAEEIQKFVGTDEDGPHFKIVG